MSIQAIEWALGQDLPPMQKLVLISIADHANKTDGYCWLKKETIAADASCSPRAVYNFVNDLIRNGYLRKAPCRGPDGRQRATNYWILLDREPAEWVGDQVRELNDLPDEADTGDDRAPQDVDEPEAHLATGSETHEEPLAAGQIPAGATGPQAPVCRHIDSAEPSKTNPKKVEPPAAASRSYRPPPRPPPQPMGTITATGPGSVIFVFTGTPAYEAWQRLKERESGRPWNLQTTREGRLGWYFPTLFPPDEARPSGETPLAADEARSAANSSQKNGSENKPHLHASG